MDALHNIDLLTVGVVVIATIILGFSAYVSNTKSVTNRMFFVFALVTAFWGIVNYFSYQFSSSFLTLWLLRAVMFAATWQAVTLYLLFRAFPNDKWEYSARTHSTLLPFSVLVSILTLTPVVFHNVLGDTYAGEVAHVQPGPGIIVFGLFAIGLVTRAIWLLVNNARAAIGKRRHAFDIIIAGVAITFALIIAFNFILAAGLGNPSYVPYGALFMFPLIAAIAFTILRNDFFNVKVAATALLVCFLAIVSLLEIVFSTSLLIVAFRSGIFVLIMISGIMLTRSVMHEVEQRELIEKQERELEVANARQENLLHFISHEIKGYLTKGQNAFAGIVEGDYGEVSPKVKELSEGALSEMRKGVSTVMDILDASNLKKGTMSFNKKEFDLKECVEQVVRDSKWTALRKGLKLSSELPESERFTIVGDQEKITRHVIRNIVDNSMRYTPSGTVRVSLQRLGDLIRLKVTDTGVGITAEDMKRLFTEGGHGKDSIKVNVDSTGYGLFVAKQVTETHGGKIYAVSEGAGKGSTFIVDLPAA